MKSFKGLNGTLVLRSTGVAIIRENMLATTFHNAGEIEIPYGNISDVEVVPGSVLNGYICIVNPRHQKPEMLNLEGVLGEVLKANTSG